MKDIDIPAMLIPTGLILGRRVRILPTADSELGRLHAGEHAEIVRQIGTLEEGIRGYTVRLSDGEEIDLKLSEVEILD
jgi:hypothetical protein